MTKRGKVKYPQDPNGWYKEPRAAVEQVADAIDFGDDLIWDPACGTGNILDVMKERGHPTLGSDIIDRHARHKFFRGNYLLTTRFPRPVGCRLSVFSNPPYNNIPGIGEGFIHHTLDNVPFRLAAFIMPIEFLSSQGRYWRLYSQRPPAYVCIYSERHTMPPGAAIEDLGDDAYQGGVADYCCIVWKEGGPYRCETIFLKPPGDGREFLITRPKAIDRRVGRSGSILEVK